ncbi:MAG: CvpA family protein [Micavibrio sp.]
MIIDIIVGIIVLASALIAFMRGFIREILTIAGVVGGILAAIFFGPALAPTVRGWFGAGEGRKLFDIIPVEIAADATTYGVIFIAVVILISVVSHFTAGAAKAIGLGPIDRTLGVIFGVIRALVLLGLVYLPFHLLMNESRKEEFFSGSATHYYIEKIAGAMASYLPDSEEVEDKTGDAIKKKLEEQNLLGGGRAKSPPAGEAPKEEGYKEEQREKLEELFNDPAFDEEAPPMPSVQPSSHIPAGNT